jgi:lipopolysaccharide/colanic/teichoic acid biosynthesis glycosyltransferase
MQFPNINVENNPSSTTTVNIIYFASAFEQGLIDSFISPEFYLKKAESIQDLKHFSHIISTSDNSSVIIIEVDIENFQEAEDFIKSLKTNFFTKTFITIFLLNKSNKFYTNIAMELGVSDCYSNPIPFSDLKERVKFLNFYKTLRSQVSQLSQAPQIPYHIPVSKRFLDLILSIMTLIFLLPLLIIGTGYKIFDFYKFRSMRTGADAELESLKHQNQYEGSSFFKFENDPRITKLGTFLRKSSIDELPQLINVIKGDMSLVGNRPLPLYEAEQLTTNEWSMRFLGPAGLTGLWQISKRGKKNMSEKERKQLDNFYAKNYSLWLDVKIILKTIPALLQREKV